MFYKPGRLLANTGSVYVSFLIRHLTFIFIQRSNLQIKVWCDLVKVDDKKRLREESFFALSSNRKSMWTWIKNLAKNFLIQLSKSSF